MTFTSRLVTCLLIAFALFPVVFIYRNGPDGGYGYFGGMILILFVQFISPLGLWKIPLVAATLAATVWHLVGRLGGTSLTS